MAANFLPLSTSPEDDAFRRAVLAQFGEEGKRTHDEIARHFLANLTERFGEEPVATEGLLWLCGPDRLWQPFGPEALAVEIGPTYSAEKNCRKVSDYRAIASHVLARAERPAFFDGAPAGVCTPAGFWRVEEEGVRWQRLAPDHRQRFRLEADPARLGGLPAATGADELFVALSGTRRFFDETDLGCFDGEEFDPLDEASWWRRDAPGERQRRPFEPEHLVALNRADEDSAPLLDAAAEAWFAGPEFEERTARFYEIAGALLAGRVTPLQKAVLFYGPGGTGKSTAAHLLRSLVPPELVTATSPQRWGSEYYVASLAGKRLNLVGELEQLEEFPAAAFKQVLGGDVCQGRHPNHRPFEFVPEALHVFLTNYLPRTPDRSDAFFRRWAILPFDNRVKQIVPQLQEQILAQELAAFLLRALHGAVRVARGGGFSALPSHDQLLARWRATVSSVTEFLADPDACELGAEETHRERASVLFDAYTRWAAVAGRKAIGRNSFFEELDSNGHVLGVRRHRDKDARWVLGVSLRAGAFGDGYDAF